ncbi:MAG: hypothetical protein Aurels2KO_15490 [Aureliella sp.]
MNDEIHPLDRDDEELEPANRPKEASLERRLLKYCIWTALAGGATICIASAATANAAYQSTAQRIGEAVEWTAGIITLAAFFGMLVVFRLKSIRGFIKNTRDRVSQAGSAARPIANQALRHAKGASSTTPTSTPTHGHFIMHPSRQSYSADLGLSVLIIGGLVYLAGVWILTFALRPFPYLAFILPTSQVLTLGMAVTMVVYNTGVTRAFAIGFLATSALSVMGIFGSLFMILDQSRYSRGQNSFMSFSLATAVSTSIICGWTCASYVWMLQKIFSPNEAAGVTNADTEPAE